jgi:hypothetical protein
MRLIERLRLLVESAPPDATVPVRWIGEQAIGDNLARTWAEQRSSKMAFCPSILVPSAASAPRFLRPRPAPSAPEVPSLYLAVCPIRT